MGGGSFDPSVDHLCPVGWRVARLEQTGTEFSEVGCIVLPGESWHLERIQTTLWVWTVLLVFQGRQTPTIKVAVLPTTT